MIYYDLLPGFTMINYDLYQGDDKQIANESQTINKRIATNKNENKEKNNICELIAHEYKEKFDGQLPMVTKLSDQRKASINGCIKQMKGTDHDFTLLETWVKYFNHASRSDFLMGVKTDWKMDFDFLITKSKMLKIIEGKYDN